MQLKKFQIYKIFLLVFPLVLLLIYKWQTITIMVSDTNIYFYTAYRMVQGQSLYSHLFFTNLPLFPLIAVGYYFLINGNLLLFYFTGAVESFLLTLLIYYACFLTTRKYSASFFASMLFAFSVYNLSNSSYQIGMFTAWLFALATYILTYKKRPMLAGVALSFCFLTKGYFLPVLLTFGYLAIHMFTKKQLSKWLLGIGVGLLPLLPFLITSFSTMSYDLFGFSLNRPANYAKFDQLGYFLSTDYALIALFLLSFVWPVTQRRLGAILLSLSVLFFLVYRDFPYIYFGLVIPYFALQSGALFSYLTERYSTLSTQITLFLVLLLVIILNIIRYAGGYQTNQVLNLPKILSQIHATNPDYMYGNGQITPALAYLAHKPLLNDVIDTNPLLFTTGFLDKQKLTSQVVHSKAVVAEFGVDLPEVSGDYLPDLVDSKQFHQHCNQLASYPIAAEPPVNRLLLFTCPGK